MAARGLSLWFPNSWALTPLHSPCLRADVNTGWRVMFYSYPSVPYSENSELKIKTLAGISLYLEMLSLQGLAELPRPPLPLLPVRRGDGSPHPALWDGGQSSSTFCQIEHNQTSWLRWRELLHSASNHSSHETLWQHFSVEILQFSDIRGESMGRKKLVKKLTLFTENWYLNNSFRCTPIFCQ